MLGKLFKILFHNVFGFRCLYERVGTLQIYHTKNNVYWEGGGHRTYFVDEGKNWGGDTAHTLLIGRTIGVGTPHNIERTK